MIHGNAGHPDGKRQSKNCHGHQVSWRFTSNRFATSNGKISNEEDNVRNNVDDESILTGSQAMSNAIFIIVDRVAVKVSYCGNKNEHSDKTNCDH